jgi:hypothetical protein
MTGRKMKKAKRHDTESVCLFPGWAVKFFGILTFAAFVIPGCNGDSGGSQGGRQNPPPLTGVKGETPPPQTKPGELTGEEVQRRRLEAALNEELGQVYIRYSRFAEAIEVYQKARTWKSARPFTRKSSKDPISRMSKRNRSIRKSALSTGNWGSGVKQSNGLKRS